MRLLPALGAILSCLALGASRAQEPPLPKTDSPDGLPSDAEPSVTPSTPALLAPSLLPPEVAPSPPPAPSAPSIPQLDEVFKQTPLGAAAENSKHHLEWRALRNQVVVDSDVKRALAAAEAARTDLEKRNLLRKYYEIYYRKMIDLAATPELKAYLKGLKNQYLSSLSQPRVRPTPSPSPSPKVRT